MRIAMTKITAAFRNYARTPNVSEVYWRRQELHTVPPMITQLIRKAVEGKVPPPLPPLQGTQAFAWNGWRKSLG